MGYKGSYLAEEIMAEYHERKKWQKYCENMKKLKEKKEREVNSKCKN